MSRSKLRNKWMRKQYAKPFLSYMRRNMQNPDRNPHRLDEAPKNTPSRYITEHCSADVNWLQEPTSFGGHSIPKGGHRRVSGLVRASVKEEVRKQIDSELENLVVSDTEEGEKVSGDRNSKYKKGDKVKFLSDQPDIYLRRFADDDSKIEKTEYVGIVLNVHAIMKGRYIYTIETTPVPWLCTVEEEDIIDKQSDEQEENEILG